MTETPAVKVKVKWYNPVKGFGFVVPEDGGADALLQAATLQKAGLDRVADGADLTCQIGAGPYGPRVEAVLTGPDQEKTATD